MANTEVTVALIVATSPIIVAAIGFAKDMFAIRANVTPQLNPSESKVTPDNKSHPTSKGAQTGFVDSGDSSFVSGKRFLAFGMLIALLGLIYSVFGNLPTAKITILIISVNVATLFSGAILFLLMFLLGDIESSFRENLELHRDSLKIHRAVVERIDKVPSDNRVLDEQ